MDKEFAGITYKIDSFNITNSKGLALSCSMVEPKNDADRTADTMPCVIYMHGNAGNKMEGLCYADQLLPLGINLLCFDFSGCGNSEGQWVTLGHEEKDDLKSVIEYLYENKRVSVLGLWGRSMGAVSSLLYMSENQGTVNCAVLDSGFTNLSKVMDNMGGQMGLPAELVQMMLPMIDQAVFQQANFHLTQMNIANAAKNCEVPAIFMHGSQDTFIIPEHSQMNQAAYGG